MAQLTEKVISQNPVIPIFGDGLRSAGAGHDVNTGIDKNPGRIPELDAGEISA